MADKTRIPAPPWTFEALGVDLYWALGKEYGCVDPSDRSHKPDLDLSGPYLEQEEARQKRKPDVTTQT